MKEFNSMRSAGRITFIVLFIVISVFIGTVYADDNGPGDNPVKPGLMVPEASVKGDVTTDKPYYDPDLESILAVKDRSNYAFLSAFQSRGAGSGAPRPSGVFS